jgi:hypothetical protein
MALELASPYLGFALVDSFVLVQIDGLYPSCHPEHIDNWVENLLAKAYFNNLVCNQIEHLANFVNILRVLLADFVPFATIELISEHP